jgi:CheY-like chemotaxis protein
LLFVDDEGDFLATIDEFFAGLGYTVCTASNGQETLLRSRSLSKMLCF